MISSREAMKRNRSQGSKTNHDLLLRQNTLVNFLDEKYLLVDFIDWAGFP